MNLDDLINDIENVQENVIAHNNAEEIAKKQKAERVKNTWQLMRDIYSQLENDFDAFLGVEFNPYKCENIPYGYQQYRVYKKYPNFKIKKIEERYSWGFTANNGTICTRISFVDNSQNWLFSVQIEKHPDNDEIKFFLKSCYYTFDEVEHLLDIPEGSYYTKLPLELERKKCFYSYEYFRDHLMQFMKSTVNIKDLKKKHNERNILKFEKRA